MDWNIERIAKSAMRGNYRQLKQDLKKGKNEFDKMEPFLKDYLKNKNYQEIEQTQPLFHRRHKSQLKNKKKLEGLNKTIA